jgi:hypothetical protein
MGCCCIPVRRELATVCWTPHPRCDRSFESTLMAKAIVKAKPNMWTRVKGQGIFLDLAETGSGFSC